MRLPENQVGLNLQLLKEYAEILRLSKRYTLQHIADIEIRQLWLETAQNNVITDVHLQSDTTLKVSKRAITLAHTDKAFAHVSSLAVQRIIVNALIMDVKHSRIAQWTKETNHLTPTLYCFARKALQKQLPTGANLHRWGRTQTALCQLCNKGPQTNKHVLNNCPSSAALARYKVRHDAVL